MQIAHEPVGLVRCLTQDLCRTDFSQLENAQTFKKPGEGPHVHFGEAEEEYAFQDVDTLINDFWSNVEEPRGPSGFLTLNSSFANKKEARISVLTS